MPAKKTELMFFVEPHHVMRSRTPARLESGSRVLQEYKHDADVTNILARYKRTGVLPNVTRPPFNPRSPDAPVADTSAISGKDYAELQVVLREAQNAVKEARENEARIKAEIEERRKTAAKAPSSVPTPTPNDGIKSS